MLSFEIKEVKSRKDWKQFIKLPWHIYENDPLWVPPLIFDLKRQLNAKVNPFFKQAEVKYWITLDADGKCCGRIAAIVNHQHNRHYNEHLGFFGYFECINNNTVSTGLFSAAHAWLKQKGMTAVRGPVNLSLTNESGLLVEGFNSSPVLQMYYNPPYYLQLLEGTGYTKEHDLFAFYINGEVLRNEKVMQRLERLSQMVTQKENISYRFFNTRDFRNDLKKIRILFNDYMKDNWGFLPMEENEIDFMAKLLKPVLIKELAIFAEVNGEPVGFSLSLPELNQVIKRINGKLFPFGIFKFLFYKNRITDIRVLLMGISKPFRRKGLEAVFYYKTIMEGSKRKFTGAELSWLSEDNQILISELESLGAKLYKRYRIMQRSLSINHQENLKIIS